MKTKFKRLGLATAVAAASASYASVSNAQVVDPSIASGNIGDLALIPYYTVNANWVTGVHIINTSDYTQVVKLRLRRAADSADALDFNLILSPKDEWTGFIDEEADGTIVFNTTDNSCTAPIRADGRFPMPFIFRPGAEEGYIEVIGMGTSFDTAISRAAKHIDGVPLDCEAVASNFFANGTPVSKGIINYFSSTQEVLDTAVYLGVTGSVCSPSPAVGGPGVCSNTYFDGENALAVSYFFRDAEAGTEFGGNATHIEDFSLNPWMTNQEFGLFSGDIEGFDYPDLNGGPLFQVNRDRYNRLRSGNVLGVSEVLNDWSVATARNVSTDWVVTLPGQYTMIDYVTWASAADLDFANCATPNDPLTPLDDSIAACDFRDIPVDAFPTLYDREETGVVPEDGNLVISPAPPGEVNQLVFPFEVNVVEWTDGTTPPVLQSDFATTIDPTVLGEFGWAELSVFSTLNHNQFVCEFTPGSTSWDNFPSLNPNSRMFTPIIGPPFNNIPCVAAQGNVPVIGFVAWQRSFPSNPDANYGRLIDHSFVSGFIFD
ncbi:MAG: hypothetical protein AAF699_01715 [Pseudomonadota bacterium]